jgi:hypothetical protein
MRRTLSNPAPQVKQSLLFVVTQSTVAACVTP